MVQCVCSVLPILRQPRQLLVPVPVKMATSETMKLHQKRDNMKTLSMKISPTDAQVSKRNVEFNARCKKLLPMLRTS